MRWWLPTPLKNAVFSLLRHRLSLPAMVSWIATLLEAPAESDAITYSIWRVHFIQKRLTLGLAIGLLYFVVFTILHLLKLHLSGSSLDDKALSATSAAASLLFWLLWLQTSPGKRHPALAFLGLTWSITILTSIRHTLRGTVTPDLKGWTMTFFAQATMIPFDWGLHLIAQLGTYAYYFGVNGALGLRVFPPNVSPSDLLLDLVWICLMSNLVVYLYERLAKAEFLTRQRLRQEQQRSQALLLNILPQSIADRLMAQHQTIADSFAEVTVLFADLVDFTQLSTELSPTALVELLNQVFSRFDELVEQHGLEKIKTIGDAYMVVAGLPEYRQDHVAAIANMALDMRASLNAYNEQTGKALRIRIGIHTGPAIAGVIGLKKFAYDIWGDTVNTASRMESHGLPHKIQVTSTTYDCLKHQYVLTKRGAILIKGKGLMTTYWLQARRNPVRLPD